MEKILIAIIKLYRYCLSPWLGPVCRFYPSCSEYAEAAIQHCGVGRGLGLTVCRLLKCHPWHRGGYDPVPTRNKT